MDHDILRPGWAGNLAPDEYESLRAQLRQDRELRYQWGFHRGRKTFPEGLLRELAMRGDPEGRRANVELTRAWRRALSKPSSPRQKAMGLALAEWRAAKMAHRAAAGG